VFVIARVLFPHEAQRWASHIVVGCPTLALISLRHHGALAFALGCPRRCGLPCLGYPPPPLSCCFDHGVGPYLGVRGPGSSSCRVSRDWAARVVVGCPTAMFALFRRCGMSDPGVVVGLAEGGESKVSDRREERRGKTNHDKCRGSFS
jgi:hypothetical protein